MAIFIDIEKVFEENGVHCYKVSPSGFDCEPFFIAIKVNLEKIYFYKDQECLDLLGSLDFISKHGSIEIDGLPLAVVKRVAAKVYRALKKGEFPHFLSIES